MYTTYHLESANELTLDVLDAIKAMFKSKPITITVEEDVSYHELNDTMKAILDERLAEDSSEYLSGEESIKRLNKKYDL